jgi:hypothetical protein
MTTDHVHSQPMDATIGVRLCDRCGRPLTALDKSEYTLARAYVVATTGFCVCPPDGRDGSAAIPDHGPSLL